MAKVDRLGWAGGFVIAPYGKRLGIRVNDPARCSELIERALQPHFEVLPADPANVDGLISVLFGKELRKGTKNYHLLYVGAGRVERTLELDKLFEAVRENVNVALAGSADGFIFVNASVVEVDGRALIVTSKELSQALVAQGARMFSERFAIIDEENRLHPFGSGGASLPAAGVVLSPFEEGAHFQPREVTPGQCSIELFANTVSAMLRPQQALSTLAGLTKTVKGVQGAHGDSEEAARWVRDWAGKLAVPANDPQECHALTSSSSEGGPRVRRSQSSSPASASKSV